MKICFLCSDETHPVNGHLSQWMLKNKDIHDVLLVRKKKDLQSGDILFLISCSEIITESERSLYTHCLVIHASDLPLGRGWSPHIWQIVNGATDITVSLLETEDKVDSGDIWKKVNIHIPESALWNEINECLFKAEIELIDFAVNHAGDIHPDKQVQNITPTYYPKRTPADSAIDPMMSICSQFNKIRVCDPVRYPAFFELNGIKYKINLEKMDE